MIRRFARFTCWLFAPVVAWQLVSGSPSFASVDYWASAVNGVWQNGANWLDGTTPGGSDVAFFNVAGAYTVSFNGTPVPIQALSVSDGTNATFTSASIFDVGTLQVTSASDSEVLVTHGATLTLGTSGGIFNPDRPLHLVAGYEIGNLDEVLTVQNNATLNVAFGSDAHARGFVDILSGGQVNIVGSGSTLTSEQSVRVGESGTGTLNVASGGQVVTLNMGRLGQQGTGEGYVVVSGANSQWLISNGLEVGGSGDGTLTIQNGGSVAITVDDAPIVIGLNAGSNGTAIVTGAGSTWTTNGGIVDVGYHGTGMLTIDAGGVLSSSESFGIIGREPFSNGSVIVTGAGATWDCLALDVGYRGAGALTIEAGGSVTVQAATIGYHDGSSGEVTVTGTGSTWTIGASGLVVAREGDGMLNITDGGAIVLPAGSANVGTWTAAFGIVNVDGLGSTWNVGGDLTITYGRLGVVGGGVVAVGGVLSIEDNGIVVGDGTLTGNLVVNNGRVLPSASTGGTGITFGALEVDGNYVQSNEGALGLGLGGTTPGSDYDQLHVTGAVTLDGRLDVGLLNSFTPSAGDAFDILDWGSLSGTFDTVSLPNLAPGLVWNTTQLYITGVLKVGLAGDYNDDGTVDAADYVVWRKYLGTNYRLPNEAGFPGIVDQFDYDVWRTNFGATTGSGSALGEPSQANVPEPATLFWLAVGGVAWVMKRRIRRDSEEAKLGDKFIIVAAAVLLSFCSFNQARAQIQPGDFITYSQLSWGEPTLPGGMAVNAHYFSVYASTFGQIEIGNAGTSGFSIIFTGSSPVLAYLPSTGPAAPLNADLVDPLSSASGIFGGEVLGLRFNVDFSDAGLTVGSLGIPFGDLVIHSYAEIPQVNGLTVRQILAQANTLLGAGTVGYAVQAAFLLVSDLNFSFPSGEPSQWAEDHLRIPGDFNQDRVVDAADYVVWRKTDGTSAGYNEWRTNFGLPAGSGSGASHAVPEPVTLLSLAIGVLSSAMKRQAPTRRKLC